jgi:hypothetical protein
MSPKKTSTKAPESESQLPSDPQSHADSELKPDKLEQRIAPSRFRLSANHNETVLA